jgi:hypothetical protein
MHRYRFLAAWIMLLSSTAATAGESAQAITDAGMPSQCSDFASKVSQSEGNWSSVNQAGCVGAFQFCPGTFERYYSGSQQDFLSDPSAQVKAWTKYEQDSWSQAQNSGSTSLVGQQVCSGGNCFTVDQSAVLMACQFGCGPKGKLANFIANGDQCTQGNNPNKPNGGSSPTNDGNGVCVASYLQRGAGYDASCFTGDPGKCLWTGNDTPTTTTTTAATADPQIAATDTNVGVADV